MRITKDHCPVCNSAHLSNYLTCTDFTVSKETFQLVKCNVCEFIFTNNIPVQNEIGKYYESENYISHTNTNKGIINKIYHLVRNYSIKQKVKLINSLAPLKGNLLDIGCGTGYFLKGAQEQKWKVKGVEPGDQARKLTEDLTNEKIEDNLFKITNVDSYDVITMWHVLEHVHELNKSLEHIYSLLKKGGKLIIAVPNRKSYDAEVYKENWAAYDVPRHLYHFSQINMDKLLIKNGFTKIGIKPMSFDSFYVSMLSEKYKNGKGNILSAFFTGLKSNWKAKSTNEYSSLIYIYKK